MGAALIRHAVLPALLPMCQPRTSPSHAPSQSMLESLQRRPDGVVSREATAANAGSNPKSELLLRRHLPPMWARSKGQAEEQILRDYPASRAFAALLGLSYSCLVVDAKNHPWMQDQDIPGFLYHWNKAQLSCAAHDLGSGLDSFLFVDSRPFSLVPKHR